MTNNIKPPQDELRISKDTYIRPFEAQSAYPVSVNIHASDPREQDIYTPRSRLERVLTYNRRFDTFKIEVLESSEAKNEDGNWVKRWEGLGPGLYHPTGFAHTNTKNYSNEKYILITPGLKVYELTRKQAVRFNQGDKLEIEGTKHYITRDQRDFIEHDREIALFEFDDFAA